MRMAYGCCRRYHLSPAHLFALTRSPPSATPTPPTPHHYNPPLRRVLCGMHYARSRAARHAHCLHDAPYMAATPLPAYALRVCRLHHAARTLFYRARRVRTTVDLRAGRTVTRGGAALRVHHTRGRVATPIQPSLPCHLHTYLRYSAHAAPCPRHHPPPQSLACLRSCST